MQYQTVPPLASAAHAKVPRASKYPFYRAYSLPVAATASTPPLRSAPTTLHRAVVLLHRYLTRYPSTAVTGMRKWVRRIALPGTLSLALHCHASNLHCAASARVNYAGAMMGSVGRFSSSPLHPPASSILIALHDCCSHRTLGLCCCCRCCCHPVQALATACVFLATKVDSAYHRLESVVHVSFRALRASQGRPLEAEYYAPNGVSDLSD
jgi:hypothetical protein